MTENDARFTSSCVSTVATHVIASNGLRCITIDRIIRIVSVTVMRSMAGMTMLNAFIFVVSREEFEYAGGGPYRAVLIVRVALCMHGRRARTCPRPSTILWGRL